MKKEKNFNMEEYIPQAKQRQLHHPNWQMLDCWQWHHRVVHVWKKDIRRNYFFNLVYFFCIRRSNSVLPRGINVDSIISLSK